MTLQNTVLRAFPLACLCLTLLFCPATVFGEEGDAKSTETETRTISFRQCTAWFNKQFGYFIHDLPVEDEQLSGETCELMHYHLFMDVKVLDHGEIAPVYKQCFDSIEAYPGPEKLAYGVPRSMAMISCIDWRRHNRAVYRNCYKEVPDEYSEHYLQCLKLRLIENADELGITSGGRFDGIEFQLKTFSTMINDERDVQRRSMFFMDHFATNTSYRCRYIPDQDRYFDCVLTEVLPKYGE